MRTIKRLGCGVRRFANARNGGVALMFALAMPPMTMMAVCGLDLQRASSIKRSLQDALDAATLAAARSNETTDAGIRTVGMRALRANLAQFPHVALDESATVTNFDLNADGSVTGTAHVDVDTLVAGAFLGDSLDVAVGSMVYRSNNRVEVALVIDNTGSMNSYGRLPAAQAAAVDLVERLEAASVRSPEPDSVRISLVPFSDTVRVSQGFTAQGNRSGANGLPWLSQALDHTGATGTTGMFSAGANRFQLLDDMRIGWGGCIESRPYPYDVRDTAPTSGNQATMFVPYFNPDQADRDATTQLNNNSTWRNFNRSNDYLDETTTGISGILQQLLNGITTALRLQAWNGLSRDVSKYTYSRRRSGIGETLGPNRGCGLAPVVRLTDNFDAVIDSIEDMEATGTTNVPMGLVWGWHTLSPRAPFADGRPYTEDRLQKIIILLTDGDNTNYDGSDTSAARNPDDSEYSGLGLIAQNRIGVGLNSSSQQRTDAMDGRMEELCRNLRAQDVMVYTVGVQVSSSSQELLRNCATEGDMFYNVTNTSGIAAAFDRIAGSIERLRIGR